MNLCQLFFFWETIILYTGAFRFKTLQDVFIHLELCYTLQERLKIHNRCTLEVNKQKGFRIIYGPINQKN